MPKAADKGPMLLIHGLGADSSSWMKKTDEERETLGMQYAQEGYDVWYGNMRGSGPSRTHKLDYYDADGWLHRDGFFWEFDYNDLAEEDLPAMIKKVYEVSGHCKKVTVIGHSLGATILPNGLSKSEHAKHYVSQAISMAPCFAPDFIGMGPGRPLSYSESKLLGAFIDFYSMKSLFGSDWDDNVSAICRWARYSSSAAEVCDLLRSKDFNLYSPENPKGWKEVSSRLLQHLNENVRLGDYRKYGYWSNDELSADLSQIEVPVSVMHGTKDTLCKRAHQQSYLDLIPNLESQIDIEGAGHQYFTGANGADFKAALDKMLTHSSEETPLEICERSFVW